MKMEKSKPSDFFLGAKSYLTEEFPGVGGTLKKEPAHFKVVEKMEPVPDRGEHVALTCTRVGMTTQEVLKKVASLFSLKNKNLLGHAGLKDKEAITTQTISLPLGRNFSLDKVRQVLEDGFPELSSIILQKRETKNTKIENYGTIKTLKERKVHNIFYDAGLLICSNVHHDVSK